MNAGESNQSKSTSNSTITVSWVFSFELIANYPVIITSLENLNFHNDKAWPLYDPWDPYDEDVERIGLGNRVFWLKKNKAATSQFEKNEQSFR